MEDQIKIGDKLEFWGYSVSCEAERERYDKGLCPAQNDERHLKVGEIYEVVGSSDYSGHEGKYGDVQGIGARGDRIVVKGCSFSSFRKVKNNKNKNNMSKIINFVKSCLLSADEKLLRENGLKYECGEYTSEYTELVTEKLNRDNEAYVIETLKAKLKSEKVSK